MKKYAFLVLLLLPITSFGAASVRMLGGVPSVSAAANTGAKITPVKAPVSKETSVSNARVGSMNAKGKSINGLSSKSLNSSSRFPVVSSVQSYNTISVPQSGQSGSFVPGTASVDTAAIIDALTRDIKEEIYVSDEFKSAVRDTVAIDDIYETDDFKSAVLDTVAIDEVYESDDFKSAVLNTMPIKMGRPSSNVSDDVLYIWIEEE